MFVLRIVYPCCLYFSMVVSKVLFHSEFSKICLMVTPPFQPTVSYWFGTPFDKTNLVNISFSIFFSTSSNISRKSIGKNFIKNMEKENGLLMRNMDLNYGRNNLKKYMVIYHIRANCLLNTNLMINHSITLLITEEI